MKDVILKRITLLNLSLLLIAMTPTTAVAQIIYGLEKATQFHATHHGPFSVYAGTFRSKESAYHLRDKIAAHIKYPVRVVSKNNLYAVVLGPLPTVETVRAAGNSLGVKPQQTAKTDKPEKTAKTEPVLIAAEQPKKPFIVSSPITTPRKFRFQPNHFLMSGIRFNLLAGNSVASNNKQGRIFFPAQTFRTDTFDAGTNNSHFASGVGVAYEKILEPNNNPWNIMRSISLGLNAYYDENSRHGSVYEYSLPDFNNATYDLTVKSYRVMLDTEWDFNPLPFGVMPFVEGGIGGVQNTMSFQNIPRPNIGADGGYYKLSGDGATQFAYEVGAGLKIPVNSNFTISARYLFVDKGKAESELIDPQTGVELASPIQTTAQSQSVLFGLSYLFG